MDDETRLQRPARFRFRIDLGEHFLGHRRVVLEGHGGDGLVTCHIADEPDEDGDAADGVVAGRQLRQLPADVEVLLLHADRHPTHEILVARIAREIGFTETSVSHEVAQLPKIVPRADTTIKAVTPYLAKYWRI